jgi:hypothetical protein
MAEPVNVDRQTVNVSEFSKISGLGLTAAWGAVRRGDVFSVRVGRRVLIPRTAVDQFLAGNVPNTPANTGANAA